MHKSVMEWAAARVEQHGLSDLNTLEVGSLNVNGSVRELFTGDYHGIDIREGDGVDEVLNAVDMEYDKEYDVVVCTEMLEHAEDWRAAINGIKKAVKVGGYILLTARGSGFGKHDYPGDYWRFTHSEFAAIFADMETEAIADPQFSGAFVVAKKLKTKCISLEHIEVNSI